MLVHGQGILIRGGSLQSVVAPDGCQTKDLLVRVGDDMARGQIVARWIQPAENRSVYVTCSYAGRVKEGSVVASSTLLLSVKQPGRSLETILYLPPIDAKKLSAGKPVQLVELVGPFGSGNPTLLRLLLGFETPDAGTILHDACDLAGLDTRAVRRQIGTVCSWVVAWSRAGPIAS